ncbi:MAG: metallophosphoesterase [Gammaproteobacteria bacterium]|nr:metallophosphoesterase [Gammaproteobacteria bacterium]
MSTYFSWLHLTDFHQGMDKQSWLWPGVKERFFDDLKRLHNKCGPWDLVLFTGDLTQQGRTGEFEKLERILTQLWEQFDKLKFSPKLLAVPGNHDLVRPNAKTPSVKLLSQWDNNPDIQQEFWGNERCPYRGVVNRACKNYLEWIKNHPFKPDNINHGILPGDFSATIKKDNASLGILGLNSAFLQLADNDYKGKLVVHPSQFHELCDGDGPAWAKEHNVCLFMTHHPPSWLSPDAHRHLTEEITEHGRFAVHLCGHLHENASLNRSEGGAEALRLWQSRSLFGLKSSKKPGMKIQRLHGYTLGKIELNGNQGVLTFWPRSENTQGTQRNFVPDYSINLTDEQHTHPQSFRLLKPVAPASLGHSSEPANDLKTLSKVSVEPARIEKTQQNDTQASCRETAMDLLNKPKPQNASMSFRYLLSEKLAKLLPTQFDNLLFSLENIYPKLRTQADILGASSQRAMNLIRFVEQQPKGLLLLCENLRKQKVLPLSIPCDAIIELETLLSRADIVNEGVMRKVFDRYLKKLGRQAIWARPDCTGQPLWQCLLAHLADPGWMNGTSQHHLLHFINLLIPYAQQADLLHDWVCSTASKLGIPPPKLPRAKPETAHAEAIQHYVLLAVSPEGGYYNLLVWFIGGRDRKMIYNEKLGKKDKLDEAMPKHLDKVLKHPQISGLSRMGRAPVLEFFLPINLLNRNLDRWKPEKHTRPFSTEYRVVLRHWERLSKECGSALWGDYWNRYCYTLEEQAKAPRVIWFSSPPDGGYAKHLRKGRYVFGLRFVPDKHCFESLRDAGVAIMLWPRKPITRKEYPNITRQLIRDLPEWLRQIREDHWEKYENTGSLSLLWDNPQRLPDEPDEPDDPNNFSDYPDYKDAYDT